MSSGDGSCPRAEEYLLRLPIFRVIYAPVKQLVAAFSPENELGL